MRFLEELVVDHFLPTVRSLLAEELRDRDLTQEEVAAAIGVSQSAVSKYVHGDVDRHPLIVADERVQQRVADLAAQLANQEIDPVGTLIELEVLIRELEAPGDLLAQLHEADVPALRAYDDAFRVHDPESPLRDRERVRASIKRAIRHIERTPEFVGLLPQVGSNIVEITTAGESSDDVAGIPGRIINVEGRVLIPGEPDFGVSGHLASLLLTSRQANSDWFSALNIRYSRQIVDRLLAEEHTVIEVTGDGDLQAAIRTNPEATVIAQTGAMGIEPITYIFGPDAPSTVKTAISTLDKTR